MSDCQINSLTFEKFIKKLNKELNKWKYWGAIWATRYVVIPVAINKNIFYLKCYSFSEIAVNIHAFILTYYQPPTFLNVCLLTFVIKGFPLITWHFRRGGGEVESKLCDTAWPREVRVSTYCDVTSENWRHLTKYSFKRYNKVN